MKFRKFDSTALPFSQGYALREIAQNCKANRIVEVGEVDEPIDEPGTLLFIRLEWNEGEVLQCDSVWHDDGLSVSCRYKKILAWEENKNGKWVETDFRPEFN